MSKLINGLGMSAQLKNCSIGDSFVMHLKQDVSQNRVMKSVTAICVRLDIKVKQKAFRALPSDLSNNEVLNLVHVERVG